MEKLLFFRDVAIYVLDFVEDFIKGFPTKEQDND